MGLGLKTCPWEVCGGIDKMDLGGKCNCNIRRKYNRN